jgi:hypothetical protein
MHYTYETTEAILWGLMQLAGGFMLTIMLVWLAKRFLAGTVGQLFG